ncbi:HNH endonuclease [Variovorax beijingensis]|uniref:HNH endonuclease n=2 Tax=Variovorax beijingensis TaxID=2496117 RepID=A0A561C4X5_9BURK|nr:HNH endonuclease [Variovorax beijingensis]
MPGKQPYTIRGDLPRFRPTSPGEDLWLALRDMYVSDSESAYPTLELVDLPRWLEPPGPFAERHIDVAVTTTAYRLLKTAKRVQKEAALDGEATRSSAGQSLVEDHVWRHMVEHMEFAALDPRPRRVLPYLVYRSLLAGNADIGTQARATTLHEAQDPIDSQVRCYCCGDTLWSPDFETPLREISLDHIWPRTLGGISTPDNLLPICAPCNGAKEDRASWSVFGVVFDHALSERGGHDEERLLGLALHRRAAGALATSEYLTLKEAFVKLGPRTDVELIDEAVDRHFFNFRAHDAEKFSFTE